jgi:hypothetical protein
MEVMRFDLRILSVFILSSNLCISRRFDWLRDKLWGIRATVETTYSLLLAQMRSVL